MEELLEWGKQQSIELNKKLEYKIVNNIGGIYTTEPIEKGEVLASCPLSFPVWTAEFNDPVKQDLFNSMNNEMKQIYFYSKEYHLGEKSRYWPVFKSFATLENLSKYGTYFLTDDDLDFISKMNSNLYLTIKKHNFAINYYLDELLKLEETFDRNALLMVILNVNSRGWCDGVYPILDLFNHSNKRGNLSVSNTTHKMLISNDKYESGEQVYISYGVNDMSWFSTVYNFYDMNDYHFIVLTNRLNFPLNTELYQLIYNNVKQIYKTTELELEINNGKISAYKVDNNSLLLTEYGPNYQLIEFLKNYAYSNSEEILNNKFNSKSFFTVLSQLLDIIDGYNTVDNITFKQVPDKLMRFYHLSHKEKEIIKFTREWIKVNNISI
jgi:hypothetical protein